MVLQVMFLVITKLQTSMLPESSLKIVVGIIVIRFIKLLNCIEILSIWYILSEIQKKEIPIKIEFNLNDDTLSGQGAVHLSQHCPGL